MDFSFSADDRLKHGWQFDLVFRTGRRETGALVRLLFVTGTNESSLVGVTVGKKIANAVRRTRGRRVMREALRRLLPWVKDGVWLVAVMRESALRASARDVYCDLAASMKKRGLLVSEWPGVDWYVDGDKTSE
ncbi:MAG: ribonuclease P protein component [Synergistes sp.]|nr:ribonuclease P protein component [Synergistes sp.]